MNNLTSYHPPATIRFSAFFIIKQVGFIFLIFVSIFAVSCSEETLDIDSNEELPIILEKSGIGDKVKLLELAQGLPPAIKLYNKYYKQENKFLKKYGSFDKENVYGLKLPQYSEDLMLIIPFASKNLKKNKILIAYYKNGEKQYKIFTKKKHKENKRERIEEGILTHLDFIFEMSENKSESYQGKTVLNKYCDYFWSSSDPSNCSATYTNCQGYQIIVYNSDKMGGCGSDYGMEINADEVVLYAPPTSPVQDSSSYAPIDNDPDTLIDDDCDYWDYECNGTGVGGDYETTNPCPPGKVKDVDNNCVDLPCNTFNNRIYEVIDIEGGYSDDPIDPGGKTNRGISWSTWNSYARLILNMDPTVENLQRLSAIDAAKIYKSMYWDKISADNIIDGDVRFLLFDFYVNAPKGAILTIQETLNSFGENLILDGKFGTKTLEAINKFSSNYEFYNKFKQNRLIWYNNQVEKSVNSYLKANPNASEYDLKRFTAKKYIDGWTNRVSEFKDKSINNKFNVNCDE